MITKSNKKRMRDINLINEMNKIEKTYTKQEAIKIMIARIMEKDSITKKDKALIKMTTEGLLEEIKKANRIIDELEAWIKSADEHYPEAIPFRETLRKIKELRNGEE